MLYLGLEQQNPGKTCYGPDMSKQTAITLHPVHNYTFGVKDAAVERDPNMTVRMDRLRERCFSQGLQLTLVASLSPFLSCAHQYRYRKEGMRQSVEGILLVSCLAAKHPSLSLALIVLVAVHCMQLVHHPICGLLACWKGFWCPPPERQQLDS